MIDKPTLIFAGGAFVSSLLLPTHQGFLFSWGVFTGLTFGRVATKAVLDYLEKRP